MSIKDILTKLDYSDFVAQVKGNKEQDYFVSKTGNQISKLFLDSEYRSYEQDLLLEDLVIADPLMLLQNCETITIKNCVFLCSLHIGDKSRSLKRISISGSLFLRDFKIYGAHENPSLEIYSSNFVQANMYNNRFSSIDISYSRFHSLPMQNNTAESILVFNSQIKIFRYIDNNITRVEFDHRQVNLEFIAKDDDAIEKHIIGTEKENGKEDNLIINYEAIDDSIFDFLAYDNNESVNRLNYKYQTIEFLNTRTKIHADQNSLVNLRHYANLVSTHRVGKALSISTKSFQSPLRILGLIAGTMCLFSLIYSIPGFLEFKVGDCERKLEWTEALYYSGITFTTVGYGDISPVGGARIFSVVEGVLGIILSSSFVVSLVRKYTEK